MWAHQIISLCFCWHLLSLVHTTLRSRSIHQKEREIEYRRRQVSHSENMVCVGAPNFTAALLVVYKRPSLRCILQPKKHLAFSPRMMNLQSNASDEVGLSSSLENGQFDTLKLLLYKGFQNDRNTSRVYCSQLHFCKRLFSRLNL